MSDGWIKLHRQLLKKAIWVCSTTEQKAILITLLLMANHERKQWVWKGQKFTVMPGQFITSLKSIAKEAGVSTQNVRGSIAKFEKLDFLTNQSTKTGRLITIVNWDSYQSNDVQITKQPTKSQQRGNKEVTTNKNVRKKESKENTKKKKKGFVKPTPHEVEEYAASINYSIDGEYFVNYYQARGWKLSKSQPMVDWKAAVVTWKKRNSSSSYKSSWDKDIISQRNIPFEKIEGAKNTDGCNPIDLPLSALRSGDYPEVQYRIIMKSKVMRLMSDNKINELAALKIINKRGF